MASSTHHIKDLSSSPSKRMAVSSSFGDDLILRRATWTQEQVNGKDLVFTCGDYQNKLFYCKADKDNRPVRATELITTRLAHALGIRTANWAIIEHEGQTFFGSESEPSSASSFQAQYYLSTAHYDEIGRPCTFPATYLAQLLAFDLFVGNPDRGSNNFLLVREGVVSRLCAIDFADSRIHSIDTNRFPVAHSTTVTVGRRYRSIHGASDGATLEMIDMIEALPLTVFSRIVSEVPDGWLSDSAMGGLVEKWGSPGFKARLALLRSGLTDGTLV